jgi:putative addiction module component (TIGR02574 family)
LFWTSFGASLARNSHLTYDAGMNAQARLSELLALSADEKLALVEALWDSLAAEPDRVPIPEWHRDVIAERLAQDDSDPSVDEKWDDLRRRLETGS